MPENKNDSSKKQQNSKLKFDIDLEAQEKIIEEASKDDKEVVENVEQENQVIKELEERKQKKLKEKKEKETTKIVSSSEQKDNFSESSNKKPLAKGIFDRDLSLVIILFIVGGLCAAVVPFNFYLFDLIYTADSIGQFQQTLFTVLSSLIGLLISFLAFNGGKILGAKLISKYEVQIVQILGFKFTKVDGKFKLTYKFSTILDLKLRLKPRSLDCKPAGHIGFAYLINLMISGLMIGLGLGFGLNNTYTSAALQILLAGLSLGGLVSLIIPFYKIIPLKNDADTDGFILLNTRSLENRTAYNIVLTNEANQFGTQDFIVANFNNYNSYYKAQTLYYNYLMSLYNDKLEEAVDILNTAQYYSKYLPEEMSFMINGEKLYIFILIEDLNKANKLFLSLKKDNKNYLTDPVFLTEYRVGLIIAGVLLNSETECLDIIEKFNSLELDLTQLKCKKEYLFFKNAREIVSKFREEYKLTEIKEYKVD